MTDLSDKQRIDRGFAAKRALEEFFDPAFDLVTAEYEARLKAICAAKPWATNEIAALANASRIVTEVRNQIAEVVTDGELTQHGVEKAKRIEKMTPSKRRLLGIAPY